MNVVTQVFAVLAGVFHLAVFAMESLLFRRPAVRRSFGGSAGLSDDVDLWAFNQGFYNLFLAVVTVVGVALVGSHREAAVALLCAGMGSMLAAALVLVTSDRSKARAAVVQGLFPALSLLSLLVWALAVR